MGNPRANACLRKIAWHSALIMYSDQSISEINGKSTIDHFGFLWPKNYICITWLLSCKATLGFRLREEELEEMSNDLCTNGNGISISGHVLIPIVLNWALSHRQWETGLDIDGNCSHRREDFDTVIPRFSNLKMSGLHRLLLKHIFMYEYPEVTNPTNV